MQVKSRRFCSLLAVLFVSAAAVGCAARPFDPGRTARSSGGEPGLWGGDAAAHNIGVGIILGEPTGVTGKMYLSNKHALDASLGAGFIDGTALSINADFLWEMPLAPGNDVDLNWYVGPGLHLRVRSGTPGDDDRDSLDFGPRALFGLSARFKQQPIELFGEAAPGIDFAHIKFTIDLAFGLRYYF
jgi:hypothetical protein